MKREDNGLSASDRQPHDARAEYARRLWITCLFVILLIVAWRLLDVLLLLFGAVLVAVLLRAIATPVKAHTRLPENWSLLLTVVALLTLIVTAGWLFGAEVRSQMEGLSTKLAQAWRPLQVRMQATEVGQEFLQWIRTVIFGPARMGYVARLAKLLTNGLGGLIVVMIGGIYLAAQPRLYRDGILLLVPPKFRAAAADTVDKAAGTLKFWLLGQLAIMVIVGTLTGIGAWLIGLPSALALGLIAGLLEFIPFLGPILTAVPALLLGLAISPQAAFWMLLLLIFVQQLEGNVLTPLVQREAVRLPPALTLFALVAMGLLFGPLGVLFSAPLTVVAYVAVGELYVRRALGEVAIDEDVFGRDDAGAVVDGAIPEQLDF